MAHIHNGMLLSQKQQHNNVICSDLDWPCYCHSEWRKSDRGRYYAMVYMWSLKNDTNELEKEIEK